MELNKRFTKAWCYQDRIWREKDPTLGVVCHQSCREKEAQKPVDKNKD